MRLPSVIALKEYVHQSRSPAFTRFNVFLRDRFSCQYCGFRLATQDLTFDHVIPRSRGGRTTWENVVTACGACNLRTGSRLPPDLGMIPRAVPRPPSPSDLQDPGRGFRPPSLPDGWRASPSLAPQ